MSSPPFIFFGIGGKFKIWAKGQKNFPWGGGKWGKKETCIKNLAGGKRKKKKDNVKIRKKILK